MDKYFVCLANSYKRGGRCVAGVEITYSSNKQWTIVKNDDGTPHWVRPITTNTHYGEIPTAIANKITLLSVVKLTEVMPNPEGAHTENVKYSTMELCPLVYPQEKLSLDNFVDNISKIIFYNLGKAISAKMIIVAKYSIMMVHAENVKAYIDENRDKSKYRMRFSYYGEEYDFPITDPLFLEDFGNRTVSKFIISEAYLVISLGLEFEGWHHKLIAAVIIPNDSVAIQTDCSDEKDEWFDDDDEKLAELLEQKDNIENKINELRHKLLKHLEKNGMNKMESQRFNISYTPARTILQFDSHAFKKENEELYSRYCIQRQRNSSIIVKKKK